MSDRFQKFASRNYTPENAARLTDDEVELMQGRIKHSPIAMSIKMHKSESTIHRLQRSIIEKLS